MNATVYSAVMEFVCLTAVASLVMSCDRASPKTEIESEQTVAETVLEKHRTRQVIRTLVDDKVFGKVPIKSYHEKVHQKGTRCELCHGVKAPIAAPDSRNCGNCHGTPEDVAERTADLDPNPHNSPHWETELPCDACHREHSTSEFYCRNCHHFEFEVP